VSYTIVSAAFANPEHTSAVIVTEEAGSVAISEVDTPDDWADMLAWGDPTVFELPLLVPEVISDRQFFQQLALDNFITHQEALDAVQTGAIPSVMEGFVNSIQDPVTQFNVRMVLSGATEFQRNHPLVDAISGYIGFDSDWIDQFFIRAYQL
jgi:hypothetical protein